MACGILWLQAEQQRKKAEERWIKSGEKKNSNNEKEATLKPAFLWPLLVGNIIWIIIWISVQNQWGYNVALVGVGSLFPPAPDLRRAIYVGKSMIVSSHVSVFKNILDGWNVGEKSLGCFCCVPVPVEY